MSVLKADTIQSTGGGAATLTKQEAAKAYSRVDPNTISSSLNVSSLTDAGTGLFEDNFTNAFGAATYSSVASPGGSTNIQMMLGLYPLFARQMLLVRLKNRE